MNTPPTYTLHPSPLGELLLVGHAEALTGLYVAEHDRCPQPADEWRRDDAGFPATRHELDAYFAGELRAFSVPVALEGTPFQREVWTALADIPHGTTATYGDLARRIGRPGASRAIGAAVGANPVSIILPCHRVVGADGTLTGYGWGTERKAWLLAHERAALAPTLPV